MTTHASVAAKVRQHKQTWPELYCRVPSCLWRVKHDGRPDTPCRKHPAPLPTVEMFPKAHDHAADEDCTPCRAQGHVPPSEEPRTPYPWCRGNPTREDCAKAGYCGRDPNCGD